ncbi:MAG: DUF5018 domain-containing protein, partial [Alistipes sp.]|nr:DUF5018 domain-containing protein [Alistipes sp.]
TTMKNNIKLLASALLLTLAGCHSPEELTPAVETLGLNSVSAQFATGDYKNDALAKFTASATSADQERFVIEIPYYYPESSENLVEISQMRVSANLDDNCFLTPSLGTLDLTQEHSFTLTRGDGSKRQICITGVIKKSDKCNIEAFSVGNLTGVIDQTKQEISLVSMDDIAPALAKYTLSYHATISPDPAVEMLDYNNGAEVTVTAFDGETTKTYTIKKNVPEKIALGIAEGSQKNLFHSDNFGFDFREKWGLTDNLNYTMGVMGDYLLVCSGKDQLIYVDKLTADYVGKVDMTGIDLSSGTNGGAICSDEADHLLICSNTAKNADLKVYTLDDVHNTPQLKMTWPNTLCNRMGSHISVRGDITGKAIITINGWSGSAGWSSFIRILVEGGVWGEPELVTITNSIDWKNGSVDIEYLTTDITGPYFNAITQKNLQWIDGATNECVASIEAQTDDDKNNNFSNVSCLYFNSKPYVAAYGGAHFGNSGTRVVLCDTSSQSAFTGTFDDSPAIYYSSTPKKFWSEISGANTSDVLLCQSPDGYFLYLYWITCNNNGFGFIRAEQFDCIKQDAPAESEDGEEDEETEE